MRQRLFLLSQKRKFLLRKILPVRSLLSHWPSFQDSTFRNEYRIFAICQILIYFHYRFQFSKYSHAQKHTELNRSITGIPPMMESWSIPVIRPCVRAKKDERPTKGTPVSDSYLYNFYLIESSRLCNSISNAPWFLQWVSWVNYLSLWEQEFKEWWFDAISIL